MARYDPHPELRDIPIVAEHAATLFVDVQNYNCHRDGALYRYAQSKGDDKDPDHAYYYDRVAQLVPNFLQLQAASRAARVEVMYTVIQNLTRDGRDRSLDYKISGFHVPPGSWDSKLLSPLEAGPDEMIIPKTSSSVFNSTNIDYVLRAMDKKFLIVAGCLTDQCVSHAVMDACDLGFYVTLVTDCCATYGQARHDSALKAVAGYCRQVTLAQLQHELVAAKAHLPEGILPDGAVDETCNLAS